MLCIFDDSRVDYTLVQSSLRYGGRLKAFGPIALRSALQAFMTINKSSMYVVQWFISITELLGPHMSRSIGVYHIYLFYNSNYQRVHHIYFINFYNYYIILKV